MIQDGRYVSKFVKIKSKGQKRRTLVIYGSGNSLYFSLLKTIAKNSEFDFILCDFDMDNLIKAENMIKDNSKFALTIVKILLKPFDPEKVIYTLDSMLSREIHSIELILNTTSFDESLQSQGVYKLEVLTKLFRILFDYMLLEQNHPRVFVNLEKGTENEDSFQYAFEKASEDYTIKIAKLYSEYQKEIFLNKEEHKVLSLDFSEEQAPKPQQRKVKFDESLLDTHEKFSVREVQNFK